MKNVYLFGENIEIYVQFVDYVYPFQIIIFFMMKLLAFINQIGYKTF